jgi:hypothetical protein
LKVKAYSERGLRTALARAAFPGSNGFISPAGMLVWNRLPDPLHHPVLPTWCQIGNSL